MIIGPRVITDKSFIQGLSAPQINELTVYFTTTSLPTLISEIIADLKLPPRKDGRIGEAIVKMLAEKMMGGHGVEPPSLKSLVFCSLHGRGFPMDGLTLPVMNGTPGIKSNASGSQLMVSQIPQQQMRERWFNGDFSTEDDAVATAWRAGIEATDLEADRERWKSFAIQIGCVRVQWNAAVQESSSAAMSSRPTSSSATRSALQ
jgi:hypothetical protein